MLLSCGQAGQTVFAGSFLRKREMILDSELLNDPVERARILVHELFHFVWLRLGNPDRASWRALLEIELAGRARGELGWSSEWRKRGLPSGSMREYVCESFCDTAAFLYAAIGDHDEFTLARRWREKRRAWFQATIGTRVVVRV